MEKPIGKTALFGTIWTIVDRFGALAIQFLIMMALSRLLSPAEFGLMGMLSLLMAIGTILIDSGFSHALIQKDNVGNDDYSTVFYINILIGLLLYVLLYMSAPSIASFFNEEKLNLLSRVVFLMFPINSFCVVHIAKLTRELEYRKLTVISVVSAIFSGAVGICWALLGYGVWALVAQQLTLYFSRLIMYWVFVAWLPQPRFSVASFHALSKLSMNLLTTSIVTTTFDNIYVFLIGRFYPVATTGYFSQAWNWISALSQLMTGVVSKAMYPIFCKLHHDKVLLKDVSRITLRLNLFISIPCFMGALVMAPNIISTFFSDKWLPCVPMFQIICLYAAFSPIRVVYLDTVKSQGKGRLFLILEVVQRVLILISIVLTIKSSISLLLWGRNIAFGISLILDMYFCGRAIGYPIKEQLKDQYKIILMSVIMMVVASTVTSDYLSYLNNLMIQTIMCILSYSLLCYIFREEMFEFLLLKIKRWN